MPNALVVARLFNSPSDVTSMMTQPAVIVSVLFVWILAAIVVTLMSGREVRYSSIEVRTSPLHCFTVGLVAVTSFVLTAILFNYLTPYRDLKNKQLASAIDKAVENLPPDYRELIQLRHFAELSYEEIASMKKLPLGTVKNKLFRARNLLKTELESFVEPL